MKTRRKRGIWHTVQSRVCKIIFCIISSLLLLSIWSITELKISTGASGAVHLIHYRMNRRNLLLKKTTEPGIIKATVSGHVPISKRGTPNSILDHINSDGKVDSRTFYDETGLKVRDIHTTDHGHPKQHPIVPHAHDYNWDEKTGRLDRTTRELTEIERKENEDIL